MELQKLIHECKELDVNSDLGICQIELNKYMLYLESIKPKVKKDTEILDCNYCGRKSAETGCMNHPNVCKNPRYETN